MSLTILILILLVVFVSCDFGDTGGGEILLQNASNSTQHEVEHQRRSGRLFQGDIRIPNVTSQAHRGLATIPFHTLLWNNDMRNGYFWITVRISNSFSSHTKDLIKEALKNLEWRSQVIKFDIVYHRPVIQIPYIHYVNGDDGCWSYIGRDSGESMMPYGQIIMFEERSCAEMSTAQHEMMHALGFGHEQSRLDRDEYIKINWDNVREDRKKQFFKIDAVDSLGTPYDYDSIMHYPPDSWSKNGKPTIEGLNGNVIGNRDTASDTDILQIRLMYQCKSGARYLVDYEAQKCSEDCRCWLNEQGCGNNDLFCNGDLVCENDTCIPRGDRNIGNSLVRKDLKGTDGEEYFFVPGAMFDIKAKGTPIKITNLYYQGIKGDVWVDIYSKEWTHFRWSETEEKWTKIGSAYLRVTDEDTPTLLPNDTFTPIVLEKWCRRGFYIQARDCGTDCNMLRVWLGQNYAENKHPFIEDESASFLEGCALKGRFDNSGLRCKNDVRGGESYTFWGGVKYIVPVANESRMSPPSRASSWYEH